MNRRDVANPGVFHKREPDCVSGVILVFGAGENRIEADVLYAAVVDPIGGVLGDVAAAVIGCDRLDQRYVNCDGVPADRGDLAFILDHIC